MESAFISARLATGQEIVLASTADSMLFQLDEQDTKEGIAKLSGKRRKNGGTEGMLGRPLASGKREGDARHKRGNAMW